MTITIAPKYGIGQELFLISEGEVLRMQVCRITTDTKSGSSVIMYHFDRRLQGNPVYYNKYECEVSDTVEGLIKHYTDKLR
jgi:hypothetical protein